MALPKFLQPYLSSYNLEALDKTQDRKLIITQVLNRGNNEALDWLGKTYSQKEIKKVVAFPVRGMWMKSILSYWQKIFNLKLKKETLNKAIINLNSL